MTTKQNRPSWGKQPGGSEDIRQAKRSTNRAARQPVYRADGAAVIGYTAGDTFTKYASGSKHMLQKPRGWACDVDVLNELRSRAVNFFKVIDRETSITYIARLSDFARYGVPLTRQHGAQVCLPLKYWSVDGALPALPAPQHPVAEQLSLW